MLIVAVNNVVNLCHFALSKWSSFIAAKPFILFQNLIATVSYFSIKNEIFTGITCNFHFIKICYSYLRDKVWALRKNCVCDGGKYLHTFPSRKMRQ
jgi:hypothetical protein